MSEENRQRFQTEEDALEDTILDEYPVPEPSIPSDALAKVKRIKKDLLVMYAGRACELVKEATIYAILPDNSLDMPRFAEQIRLYPPDTLFAVSRQEWQNSMVFHDMVNARMGRQMERERAFLRHKGDCYAIYQLHIVDKPMSLEAARRSGLSPRLCGYDLIYTATLPQGSGLEELRRKFTQQLPIDCVYQTLPSGKIPDVSNIIAIKKDGKLETWYVDQLAYSQLTGMFEQIALYGTDGQGHQQPLPYEIPLYRQTGQYALERGELPAYFASHNANIACRDAIDRAIAEHYHVAENLHGGTLDIPGAIRQVREEFGYERMLYVLACSIRQKSWDGRISRENIHWAESISVIADIVPPNTREDRNLHFLIDYTHPCQLDAFTKAARRDYDLHRPLSGEEIAGEAERIFNDLNTMKETNGPGYQDFVVEISPDFVLRANADDLRILSSMMPFQSFELTAMREFYSSGFFAKIAGNEKRGVHCQLRPPSADRQRPSVLAPELEILRLYMPLCADLLYLNRDEYESYGNREYDDGPLLEGAELVEYRDAIAAALKEYQKPEKAEEALRGLMAWYGEENSVNDKVCCAVFDVECREGALWGVANCQVSGSLTPDELELLKSYLSGQASDGVGEGFEQQDIDVGGDVINVHFWHSGDSWSIQTEQERFPPLCVQKEVTQAGTLRFYMPVNADLYADDEPDEPPEELSGYNLFRYADEITQALEKERMPQEAERGLMRWYGKNDSVDEKVDAVFFHIECRERTLWCVAECKLNAPLTQAELDTLREYSQPT